MNKWSGKEDLRFIDYQFMRIFEDLCEAIRFVEDPVPDEIFHKVNSLEKLKVYIKSLKEWFELSGDKSDEQLDEVYEVAREWLYGRRLSFDYLVDSPDCFLIRNGDQLHIYWIAEHQDEQGIPFWEESKATFSCNYQEFISALIESFKAFGLAMRKQISGLFENTPEKLIIDREQIMVNQFQYEEWITELENKRLFYADSPDWNNVVKQIDEILRNKS